MLLHTLFHSIRQLGLLLGLSATLISCSNNPTLVFAPSVYHAHSPCKNGDELLAKQNYSQAADIYKTCLTGTNNPVDSLYIVNQVIYAYNQLYDPESARLWFRLANQLFDNISNPPDIVIADVAFNQGRYLFLEHQHRAAVLPLHKALQYYNPGTPSGKLRRGQVLTTLALLHYEYHPTTDSLAYYADLAYEIFQEDTALRSFATETYFVKGCASLYDRAHERGEGYAKLALSNLQADATINPVLVGRINTLLGNMYKKRGDIAQINTPEDSAIALAFHQKADSLIQTGLNQLMASGSSFWQESFRDWIIMGKRFAYNQPDLLLQRLATHDHLITFDSDFFVFPSRLKAYHFVGTNRDSMIYYYEHFLEEHLQRTNTNWQLQDEAYYRLRMGYLERGDYEKAITNLLRGEALFGCCPNDAVYQDFSMARDAKNWSTPCLNGLVELIDILFKRYQQNHRYSDLTLAAGYLDILDQYWIISILRSDEDALLNYFTEVGQQVYPQALAITQTLWASEQNSSYWAESFYFAERMKSFLSYRNQLAGWQDYGQLRELQAGVNRYNRMRSRRKLTKPEQQDWLGLQDTLEETLLQWRADSAAFLQAHRQERITPQQIQSLLQARTGLLHLTYHDQVYYAHYIDTESQTSWKVSADTNIQSCVKNFRESISNKIKITPRDVANYQQSARCLFDHFVAPAGSSLDRHPNLIIVSDGPLANLPFDAFLRPEPGVEKDNYLLRTHAISYSPSWKILKGSLTRFTTSIKPKKTSIWTSADLVQSEDFQQLHETIRQLFKLPEPVVVNGTTNHFLENISGNDLIHLSLHARSSSQNRHENTISLADHEPPLFGYDLASATIPAKLLVLAACETAAGPQRFGEGTFNLVRSFQQAGVEQLIAGLWKIPQTATAVLLQLFYQHLAAGMPVPQALRRAKLDFIEAPPKHRMEFPAFWAGIVGY